MPVRHLIRKFWTCARCGETDRHQLIRRRCVRPMTYAAKMAWLKRPDRPEVLFKLKVCSICDTPFFCLIIDNRKKCYAC